MENPLLNFMCLLCLLKLFGDYDFVLFILFFKSEQFSKYLRCENPISWLEILVKTFSTIFELWVRQGCFKKVSGPSEKLQLNMIVARTI